MSQITPAGIKKAKLKRMSEILSKIENHGRDKALLRELVSLANDPEFTGMDVRRTRLQFHLDKLDDLKQGAAIDKCWSKIDEIVYEFPSEIADASSTGSIGGTGSQ
jgi:hypothetical protein